MGRRLSFSSPFLKTETLETCSGREVPDVLLWPDKTEPFLTDPDSSFRYFRSKRSCFFVAYSGLPGLPDAAAEAGDLYKKLDCVGEARRDV